MTRNQEQKQILVLDTDVNGTVPLLFKDSIINSFYSENRKIPDSCTAPGHEGTNNNGILPDSEKTLHATEMN
jgi:hypothetical protein